MIYPVSRPVAAYGFYRRLQQAGVVVVNTPSGMLVSNSDLYHEMLSGYDLAAMKADRKAEVREVARLKYDAVTSDISAAEMAGWPILVSEALAYRASGAVGEAIQAEATIRGITVADLVTKIEGNAAAFQGIRAAIAGTDGRKRDEIDALTTFEAVAAYNIDEGWPL